jgi:hypothetical protein
MLTIYQANGNVLNSEMSVAQFQDAIATAAPSPWITITETRFGTVYLNTFTVSYYFAS